MRPGALAAAGAGGARCARGRRSAGGLGLAPCVHQQHTVTILRDRYMLRRVMSRLNGEAHIKCLISCKDAVAQQPVHPKSQAIT